MFKNLSIYKLGQWPKSFDAFEHELEREVFAPSGETQQKSVGWVPLRGEEYGALADPIAGQWLSRFCIETKSVPAQALDEAVEAKCKSIQAETGRHPGKKERRDLRDDALLELLPRAFPRRSAINVWIRPKERMLVVGTDSQGKVDEVINSLVRVAGQGFTVARLQTKLAPQAWMAQCMLEDGFVDDETVASLELGNAYRLRGDGEEPEEYRVDRVCAGNSEARDLLRRGVLPTELALIHADRVSFTLTRTLALKRIKLIDIQPDPTNQDVDRFDSEVALWTGSLAPVIDDVILALGGEA